MNGLRQGWLVARRELWERSRSRAFRASLAIMIVTVALIIVLPSMLKPSNVWDVGFTGSVPPGLAQGVQSQSRAVGTTARIHPYATLAAGEEAVRQRQISVLVVDARRLEWPGTTDQRLRAVVTGAIELVAVQQRAAAAGITPESLGGILAPVQVTNVELGSVVGRGPDDETAALFMTGLMVLAISAYGGLVLSSVVEEKSSRVVEVVLARIPARNLLAGKVAGIGLLGLAQVGVTAVAALVAMAAVGSFDIPAVRGAVVAWLVVWFVLGYLLYATIYGALGALASRPEDAQSVAGPAMAIMVVSYLAAFFMVRQPYSPFARIISFVPFSAPLAMPNRVAMGAAAWWEPMVSVGIALATIAGLVLFAGRIYEKAILHSGPALALRDVLHRPETPGSEAEVSPSGIGLWLAKGHAFVERRAAMGKRGRTVSPRGLAEILALAAVVGLVVWMLTSDVVIGVIAGGAFASLVEAVARIWVGHGGHHLTHN